MVLRVTMHIRAKSTLVYEEFYTDIQKYYTINCANNQILIQ